jgi:hypothetical protein
VRREQVYQAIHRAFEEWAEIGRPESGGKAERQDPGTDEQQDQPVAALPDCDQVVIANNLRTGGAVT